jgi:hypothetical protein
MVRCDVDFGKLLLELQVVGRLKQANCAGYRYGYTMEQDTVPQRNPSNNLDQLREAIALVQVLDLNEHCDAYDQIHIKLEEALRSIDGM